MDRRQKRSLIRQLEADAERIARHFGLRYRAIEAELLGLRHAHRRE